jgi:hypothetical protein
VKTSNSEQSKLLRGKLKMKKIQRKSLIQKWAPVLESDIGAPIRSQTAASVMATVLENQVKLNKGFLPESANVTADVEVYQQYALPLIRRQFPELLAMNTVAVIPTTTPQGIYFALRYLYDGTSKSNQFRYGEKKEIGFDLDQDHTGQQPGNGTPWSTAEGEFLSNYQENNTMLNTFDTDGNLGGNRIKRASIKVIKGSVIVGTRAIKSHYTLELQQDLAAVHGQDIEALLLEALQFEIQQEIDREILSAMKFAATSIGLGGETAIPVDLSSTSAPVDGRWAAERIAGGIVNTILAVAQKIAVTSRMGSANFCIASPDVVAAISTLNNGIYIPTYMQSDMNTQPGGGVAEAGVLLGGGIKVYRDIYAVESYALVGYKGPRQGESGVIFMPYIPYIFTKTAGQEDGSPRLIVKSRYAIVANLLGAGQFYRKVEFANINSAILGIDSSVDAYPWEVSGASYDAEDGLGGVGTDACGRQEGDTNV